jgi:hypothetical protein
MSLFKIFTNIFGSTTLKVKFNNSENKHFVLDKSRKVMFVGSKELCKDYVKNFSWSFHS